MTAALAAELARISLAVAAAFEIPIETIRLAPRHTAMADRHVKLLALAAAAYLARERTAATLSNIGAHLGRRPADTAAGSIRRAERLLSANLRFAERIGRATAMLEALKASGALLGEVAPALAAATETTAGDKRFARPPQKCPKRKPGRVQLRIRPSIVPRLERIARLVTSDDDVGIPLEALTLPAWQTGDIIHKTRLLALRTATYLAIERGGASPNEVGKYLGGRAPGEVRALYRMAVRLTTTQPTFAERVRRLERQLAVLASTVTRPAADREVRP